MKTNMYTLKLVLTTNYSIHEICMFKGFTQGGVVLISGISYTKVLVIRRTTVNTTSNYERSTSHNGPLEFLFFTATTDK